MSHTFTPGETPSLGKRKERAGGCSALDSHLFYSHMGRGKKEGLEFFEIAKQHFTARWDLFLTIYVYLIRLFCFLSVSWIYVLFFTVYLTLCARAQGPLI